MIPTRRRRSPQPGAAAPLCRLGRPRLGRARALGRAGRVGRAWWAGALVVLLALAPIWSLALPQPAMAQGAGTALSLGGLRQQDRSAPVEIEAAQLEVDQQTGLAVFTGDVVVTQADMVMTAPRIEVEGDPDRGGDGIREVRAYGGVALTAGDETARAAEGVYDVATGGLILTGDVVLTQGTSTLRGQRLVADLNTGTGVMEGRVRTVFVPGAARSGTD